MQYLTLYIYTWITQFKPKPASIHPVDKWLYKRIWGFRYTTLSPSLVMQNFWPIIIQTIKVEQYGNGVIISIKGLKLRAGALSICDKGSITLYRGPFQIRISRGSLRRTHGKSNVICGIRRRWGLWRWSIGAYRVEGLIRVVMWRYGNGWGQRVNRGRGG